MLHPDIHSWSVLSEILSKIRLAMCMVLSTADIGNNATKLSL
ncbi:hypothetical protein GAMM_60058 [Gammaproteobacteria bacterium]